MRIGGLGRLAATAFVCLLVPLSAADSQPQGNAGTHTRFVTAPPPNLAKWTERRAGLEKQILTAAGLYPMPARGPVAARQVRTHDLVRYSVSTVLLETLPGYFLAGNLYLPHRTKGRTPAVLVAHGHWKHGRVHHAEDYSVPALCVNLAGQGYAVFAYDMTGYNDTRQTPHSFGSSRAEQLWSFSPLGLQLWNSLRAFDYLAGLEQVDATRIGVTGASGGGTQTILLAAVEPRISASAPVNMVSAHFQGDDACEMAPGLRIETNNVEIGAMAAPRPQLLVSSTRDWTKDTPRVEFPAIRAVYRLYGQAPRIAYAQIDAPHNYNRESREAVYAFFQKNLAGVHDRAARPREEEPDMPPAAELLLPEAWHSAVKGSFPAVFASWRQLTSPREPNAAQRREILERLSGACWPRRIRGFNSGDRVRIEGGRRPVPAVWTTGRDPAEVAVVVHASGADAARKWLESAPAVARDAAILALDVHGAGVTEAAGANSVEHLTFHYSDDALRVQDIVNGLAFAQSMGPARVRLVCPGKAGLWCACAAAIAPIRVRLETDIDVGAEPEERVLHKYLFIPGLQRVGGLRAVWPLTSPSRTSE